MSCIGYSSLEKMPSEQVRLRRVGTSTSTEFPASYGSIERDIYSFISATSGIPRLPTLAESFAEPITSAESGCCPYTLLFEC